ncbi:spore germination protein [Anaerobranca gottschalkii]|uniref:Spore germination protein KA n=1 Tax=Anaerobranca gottschalkii DSM 13577 TaxID=1120990 RepID=A0A1I0ALL0_9FIRM|nr:spore germination protein [Anaerobranca gottschalkii]SES94755.1 spore germination protein KA [Anaerobranca gottschalkii DSM 13577]
MKKPIKLNNLKENTKESIEKITEEALKEISLDEDLEKNIQILEKIFQHCDDVNKKTLHIEGNKKGIIFFLSGITDEKSIVNFIINPLLKNEGVVLEKIKGNPRYIEEYLLVNHSVEKISDLYGGVIGVLEGKALLLIDGYSTGYTIEVREYPTRDVQEPITQTLVRGPREGFTEGIKDNLALIRKRIKTPDLKIEKKEIGHLTKTSVAICYIQNLVDPKVLEEVKVRLDKIKIDAILDSSTIEQLIEDSSFSPFPQIGNTERPDAAVSALIEGRVCIVVDGSPFVLIVPQVLVDMLHITEDYYERFYFSTAIRLLRYLAFGLSLLGPSLYVAITTFHHEMIPTKLLVSIAAARQGIPFPAFLEALMMEIAFEALREAGVRLPKPIGQAVSIVGALVIGEAAVQAGLVSQIMVIVVAGTGIASFTVPAFNIGIAIRLLKIPILLLSSVLGLFGVSIAVIAISIHLSTLRSFGVPYLSPIAPLTLQDNKDVILRGPVWWINQRPTYIAKNNVVKLKSGGEMKPQKPQAEEEKDVQKTS